MPRRWRALIIIGAFLVVSAPVLWAADGDVVLKREGEDTSLPRAVFPHWIHRIRYRCYVCHPEPFDMQGSAPPITMDAIMAGRFCGGCHNGRTAWAVDAETCNRCHVQRP